MNYGFCVLSYNHPHLTADCLNSVLKFISPEKTLLCHNGSLKTHQDFLTNQFPKIHHVFAQENKGYSGGMNFLLKESFLKWDWVYALTNDTLLHSFSNKDLEPGFYAPIIYRRKINMIDSVGGGFIPEQEKIYHFKSFEEWNLTAPLKFPYIPGTAFILHKSVFEKIGLFDETLHTYWEDVDFSVRAFNLGIKMGPSDSMQLIHKVGKTCHKNKFYTSYLFQKNKTIVSNRYKFNL